MRVAARIRSKTAIWTHERSQCPFEFRRLRLLIPATKDRCASDRSAQVERTVARCTSRLFLPEHSLAKCTVNFGIWYKVLNVQRFLFAVPVVGLPDAVSQCSLGRPAEGVEAARVHQFARRAVRLRLVV